MMECKYEVEIELDTIGTTYELIPQLDNEILLDAELAIVTGSSSYDSYNGPYTVTPSTISQTFSTQNKVLLQNMTVSAIPSNYGLITWNGSILTVS